MSTNIGRDNADASYRYKMPVLQTKIEGRGNGIKTVIVNMLDIAKALHIHPAYPTKFFGIELGAQSKYNMSTERAIVNGAHTSQDLAKLLDKFIQIYILCPTCKLPEIKMSIKSTIKIDCAACGHNGLLKTSHKLSQYMIKNPPKSFSEKEENKGKKGKKDKDEEEVGPEDAASPTNGDKDKDEKKKKKKKDKAEKEAKVDDDSSSEEEPVKEKKKKDKEVDEKPKEEEWFTDTSKEAQKQRKETEMKEMAAAAKAMEAIVLGANKSGAAADSPVTVLRVFLAGGTRTPMDVVGELKRVSLARGLDEPQRIKVLLESLIDIEQPKNVASQFKKHSPIFKLIASEPVSQTMFIQCIEDFVGVTNPKLITYIPHILKTLYEEDVLEEETILTWADTPPESSWLVNKDVATAVRYRANPFIEWLKNADEESDEE